MERKRARAVGVSSGGDDTDPDPVNHLMLREAQLKAVSVELGRYRSRLAEVEARECEAQAAKSALFDVVSLLARQFEAVSAPGRPPAACGSV